MKSYITITGGLATFGLIGLVAAIISPFDVKHFGVSSRFDRIADALEAYAVDNNGVYPPDGMESTTSYPIPYMLSPVLTTPIAYLSPEDMIDPFKIPNSPFTYMRYINFQKETSYGNSASWTLTRPSYLQLHGNWILWSGHVVEGTKEGRLYFDFIPYDSTNGTLSSGSRFRSQRLNSETGISSSAP